MDAPAPFCGTCGRPFEGDAAFCGTCGRPRELTSSGGVAAPRGGPGQHPAPARQHPALAPVAQLAGVASALVGQVPWQTISAGRTPDVAAFLAQAGTSAARGAMARSLRRPGLALAVTTLFDLFVAYLGGAATLAAALPRTASGLVTGLFGAAVGSKTGPLRTLSGILSLGTALVTLVTAAGPLLDALNSGADVLTWLPAAVTFASMLASAARTAATSFRRTP